MHREITEKLLPVGSVETHRATSDLSTVTLCPARAITSPAIIRRAYRCREERRRARYDGEEVGPFVKPFDTVIFRPVNFHTKYASHYRALLPSEGYEIN